MEIKNCNVRIEQVLYGAGLQSTRALELLLLELVPLAPPQLHLGCATRQRAAPAPLQRDHLAAVGADGSVGREMMHEVRGIGESMQRCQRGYYGILPRSANERG